MQDIMQTLINYGYMILFIYSLGGGMLALLAAGALSASGKFDIYTCIILAFIGNTLGSTLLFILGKYYKKDILPYFKNHKRKLALAILKIKQYGIYLLIIQKFIYGFKTFIPIAAGVAKYNFLNFFIINTLGSLLWAVSLGLISYLFGYIIEDIMNKISNYPYLTPLFLLFLIICTWLYLSKFSKK